MTTTSGTRRYLDHIERMTQLGSMTRVQYLRMIYFMLARGYITRNNFYARWTRAQPEALSMNKGHPNFVNLATLQRNYLEHRPASRLPPIRPAQKPIKRNKKPNLKVPNKSLFYRAGEARWNRGAPAGMYYPYTPGPERNTFLQALPKMRVENAKRAKVKNEAARRIQHMWRLRKFSGHLTLQNFKNLKQIREMLKKVNRNAIGTHEGMQFNKYQRLLRNWPPKNSNNLRNLLREYRRTGTVQFYKKRPRE